MQFRKVCDLGGKGDSRTYGISLNKKQLEFDGILEALEDGVDIEAVVEREGPGEWLVTVPIPEESDSRIPKRPGPPK